MPSGRETASKFVEPSSPLSNNRASASDTRKSAGALTKKAAPAKPTKEVILAGDFPKTRIFMSSGEGSSRKWADTEIQGSLEIVEIGKDDLENAQIRMVAIDNLNVRRGILLEYELPFNFVFKPKQTDVFSSVQLMCG